MRKRLFFAAAVLITSAALVGIGAAIFYASKPKPAIPSNVAAQAGIKPFVPGGSQGLTTDKSTIKYDPQNKGISFVASSNEFGKLTVSEQATPQEFIDIPDYYTKLTDNLNRYAAFENQLGTVYLTKPKDQSSGQTAILNSSGVLMFVRSEKDLSDVQWRKVMDSFELQR